MDVAAIPAPLPAAVGNITAAGQSVSTDVTVSSNIMAHLTGTFAGHNATFEGSLDGTNWFGVQAVRTNANTVELTTGVLGASPAYAWELSVNGLTRFRVRATAHGSGTAVWRIQPAPFATEPMPAAQVSATQPVSGSVTATLAAAAVLAGDVALGVRATTTNAVSGLHRISTADANAVNIKASAGRFYGLSASNSAASWRYLKLHNVAGAPTPGAGVVRTFGIPPGGRADIILNAGAFFATGIAMTITAAAADADTQAIGAGEVVAEIWFA